jgi:hypothetical protein
MIVVIVEGQRERRIQTVGTPGGEEAVKGSFCNMILRYYVPFSEMLCALLRCCVPF